MFGVVMVWEVVRYVRGGRIDAYFHPSAYHFTFPGFGWVRPWPEPWMHVHFAALGVLAACIALGLAYRAAALLFLVGFTHVFLIEATRYLNHFYLICLLSLLLAAIPAHRALSVDAALRPSIRSATLPAWCLHLLRFQVGAAYFFGGVAKLDPDWLRGEPMRAWLANRAHFPVVGPLFTEEWMVGLFTYGGLAFDLCVVPALLFRRTRMLAFGAAVVFHVTNAHLFRIGVFPWLMIGATLLFFPPDWPRRLLPDSLRERLAARAGAGAPTPPRARGVVTAALLCYAAVQVALPLRHLLYPHRASWSEEGQWFAWRMKLRGKGGRGSLLYRVVHPDGRVEWVDPAEELTADQLSNAIGRPELIRQYAHRLAERHRREGREVAVYALTSCALNGRVPEPLVDPDVDLARVPFSLGAADWILPLTNPLPPRDRYRHAAASARAGDVR